MHWLTNVPVGDSINYMKTFMSPNAARKLNDSAVTVISLTKGDQALNELLTLARDGSSSAIKGNALFWLAQRAGQKAVGTITAAIENDPDTEVKKKAVFALSQLPKDEGVPLLIQQARTNGTRRSYRRCSGWANRKTPSPQVFPKKSSNRAPEMVSLGSSKDPRRRCVKPFYDHTHRRPFGLRIRWEWPPKRRRPTG